MNERATNTLLRATVTSAAAAVHGKSIDTDSKLDGEQRIAIGVVETNGIIIAVALPE